MMDLDKITAQLAQLCKEVGSYIQEQARQFTIEDIEEKGKQDLVTYVDREAEKRLVKGLGEILPGSEFLAEEHDYRHTGKTSTWVIDPLDGTTNFIHGLPIYSISVALMNHGELLSGVVYHISADELYYAWKGSGAFLNGNPIAVSRRSKLNDSLLVTGFPYKHQGKLDQYLAIFKELVENSRGIRRLGSAAIDLCYVAAGRMEGFYEYGLNPWDVAAGALIVQQAGGKVTDFYGGAQFLFGGQLLATNDSIHDELKEIIFEHFQ